MFQTGEIVWGRMRGFPWWPARIITPTPDQLDHLSVSKVPPDHRLVWFFNDNGRYTILSTKSLSPFSNPDLSIQTKKKTGKAANKLKLAFDQATAEHYSTTKSQSHLNANSKPHRTDSPPKRTSKRNSNTSLPDSTDHQTHPLSAKSISSSDRCSQQTTNHLPPSEPPSEPLSKSNLLRLRIREPHSVTIPRKHQKLPDPVSQLRTEHPQLKHNHLQNTHLASNPERTKRASKPSLKLRHDVIQKDEQPVKKRRRQTSQGTVKRIKLESPDVQTPHSKFQSRCAMTNERRDSRQSKERPLLKPRLSIKSKQPRELERKDRSTLSFQRSTNVHRTKSRYDENDGDSVVESEDEDDPPVGSKRSRGVEAPRLSDGQRRLHIRQERKNDLRTNKQKNEDHKIRAAQRATRLTADHASNEAKALAARPFEALTKDQCVTIIRGMQEALRCKNVRIWLQGCRLVEAAEIRRTEKDLIQACEPAIAKAEKLVEWAKRHEDFDSGADSRFARLEERAVQGCVALNDVYFDRRKVSLREIGRRVFQLTKELPAYSRRLSSVLEELLVLWVDLTSRS